jgi:serine/threonine protein phosphatase PrpC
MQTVGRVSRLKFETAAVTHVGRVRKANEDAILVRADIGVWAVADGVGGLEAGQFASNAVVSAIDSIGAATSQTDQLARFRERILLANDRISHEAGKLDGGAMGSTVAALVCFSNSCSCLWAGDSRVYRLRQGTLEQLTHDHSEVQEMIDAGALSEEEARVWPRRNVITRAVGIFEDPDLETRSEELMPQDTFLLCSDGLTNHVSDQELVDYLAVPRAQEACDALLALALERGGKDNISIIVVRCHRAESTRYIPGGKPVEPQARP